MENDTNKDKDTENTPSTDEKNENEDISHAKKHIKILVLVIIISFLGVASGFIFQSSNLLSNERDLVDKDEFDFPNGTSPNGIDGTAAVGIGHLNTLASESFTFTSSGQTNNQTQMQVIYKYNNTQNRGVEYANFSSETPLGYQNFSENKSYVFDTTNQTIQTSDINASEYPIVGWRETTGIIENVDMVAVRTYTINNNESVVVYEIVGGDSNPENSTITNAEGEIHLSENVYYKYVDVTVEQTVGNRSFSIQTQRNITNFSSTTVDIPSWYNNSSQLNPPQ